MEFLRKILPLDQLKERIDQLKSANCKIAHCHGTFDLIHPGHLRHFQEAKGLADILIVTLTPDRYVVKGEGRPIFSEELRMESIASLEYVDYVGLNDAPDAIELLASFKPHFYVKGSDYINHDEDPTGKISNEVKAVENGGGKIHYTKNIRFSSTELIKKL